MMDGGHEPKRRPVHPDEIDDVLIFGNPETRRKFLKQIAGTSAAITLGPKLIGISIAMAEESGAPRASNVVDVHLKINGSDFALKLDPRVTLLDALREHLHLTGSKKGCDQV